MLSRTVFRSGATADSLVLAALVLLSVILYLPHLGFYSDDWGFLGAFATAPDQSIGGLWHRQYEWHTTMRIRPTQMILQVLVYWLFDFNPAPYHIFNTLVLVLLAVVLYRTLRELSVNRPLAVAVPAIYLMLPTYSTNRFWFASFGYAVSMMFGVLSLYFDLRGLRHRSSLVAWKLLALIAVAISALGYEVVIPLLLFAPLLVWHQARRTSPSGSTGALGMGGAAAYLGSNVFILLLILAYKVFVVVNNSFLAANTPGLSLYHVAWVAYGALKVNFGTYGVALPDALMWSVDHVSWTVLVVAGIVGVLTFGYVTRLGGSEDRFELRRISLRLASLGVLVFGLGYAIFVVTVQITFTSTGNGNRANMAGALGMAILFAAGATWLSSFVKERDARQFAFGAIVAALCVTGFLINNALAGFWTRAWDTERAVMSNIEGKMPDLPSRTTVLVSGVCPYVGPAVVFETWWDTSGILQVLYNDQTLEGDVTTGEVMIKSRGIRTSVYGERFHRYGPRLILFQHRRGDAVPLVDAKVARHHLSTGAQDCPASIPGEGVTVLPFDYARLPFVARIAELLE
jgi:hypothetical protein